MPEWGACPNRGLLTYQFDYREYKIPSLLIALRSHGAMYEHVVLSMITVL